MEGPASIADHEAWSCPSKDGPVLTMINKRLRALRKKYNRILQIEESKAQGKQINKEQEDVLKGKLAVGVLIEEFEKLKPALKEELEKETTQTRLRNEEERAGDERNLHLPVEAKENTDAGKVDVEQENAGIETAREDDASCGEDFFIEKSSSIMEDDCSRRRQLLESGMVPFQREVNDLLHLLYFAQLFDLPLPDASPSLIWTKIHERSSCVSYDCVTEEDASSPLEENDLNHLSRLGSLITSRPSNATLSHHEALQQCTKHALLWLANSDVPIKEGDRVTYSHLRERLSRILSSEYYTMTPELQTIDHQSVGIMAAGSGHYPSQGLIHAAFTGAGPPSSYAGQGLEQDASSETCLQEAELHSAALPTRNLGSFDSQFGMNSTAGYLPESDAFKDDVEGATDHATIQDEHHQELESELREPSEIQIGHEPEGQQQELEATSLNSDPGGYQSLNGDVGQRNNHSRSGTTINSQGGYAIGQAGLGNGHGGQFSDQQRAYLARNQNGRGSVCGIRGIGSSNFNGHGNGPSQQ